MVSEKATLSVMMWPEQFDVFQKAAAKLHMPMARFIREHVVTEVARLHGIPAPKVPVIYPHRAEPPVEALAETLKDPDMVSALAKVVISTGQSKALLAALREHAPKGRARS